ncbi:MAG: nucleotide exchange factor GrpE, partial [Polyangiaceae bacterium]|nr:nucleotide exchange factor GrpE [Polyangiaceae bacterium]
QTQAKLVADLLPVLDNLDRSIKAATGAAPPALLDGLRMVVEQFESVLRGYGLERVLALGQPFDPSAHEAVAVTPVQLPEDDRRVVDEITPGYRFDAHMLRPATVRVGKLVAPPDESAAPNANEPCSPPRGDCL